jgi:Domain of unknown function (DUF4436)
VLRVNNAHALAPYEVDLQRSPSTMVFAIVILCIFVAIAAVGLFVAIQTVRDPRRFQSPMTTWYAAMLFAVLPLETRFRVRRRSEAGSISPSSCGSWWLWWSRCCFISGPGGERQLSSESRTTQPRFSAPDTGFPLRRSDTSAREPISTLVPGHPLRRGGRCQHSDKLITANSQEPQLRIGRTVGGNRSVG